MVASEREGYLEAEVRGKGAAKAFANEAGGHRFQRVPPSEKRGRVHTSTITVAVLASDHATTTTTALDPKDVTEERYKGGSGGQHQNKHANNVRVTHHPTGVTAQVEGRYYHKNRAQAWTQLQAKVATHRAAQHAAATSAHVAAQVGSGMRGDKRRTIALQRDEVTDHVDNWRMSCKRYLRGNR